MAFGLPGACSHTSLCRAVHGMVPYQRAQDRKVLFSTGIIKLISSVVKRQAQVGGCGATGNVGLREGRRSFFRGSLFATPPAQSASGGPDRMRTQAMQSVGMLCLCYKSQTPSFPNTGERHS